jgi:hypothetical protein
MLKRALATASVTATIVASTALFTAPQAQAATYTKCYRDAPVTTCITTSGGKSVGWVRVGSYVLPKSKVNTTSTCSVSQTASTKWSISLSISAEGSAWVFAKVSATVTGGLEQTTTIQSGVSRSFKQKKGEAYRCEWGYAKYTANITKRVTAAGKSVTTKGKLTAPQEMQLRVVKL